MKEDCWTRATVPLACVDNSQGPFGTSRNMLHVHVYCISICKYIYRYI